MHAIACIDETELPLDEARIAVVDRGFLYGDAVFEALRTFKKKPDALERHLERLERSCGILGFALGVPRSVVAHEIERALHRIDGPEGYIRIMVTRGDFPESLAPKGARSPRRVIIVRSLTPAPLDRVHSIKLASCLAPPSPLWAGAKPTAYINNLLAIARAQESQAEDALLLGAHGELLEGATSSAFLIRDGQIYTPPIALGILPGITRDRVLACAARAGVPARERLLTVHDAYKASEMFMTSSVRGIVSVSAVDGVKVGDGGVGPITQRIFETYRAEVEGP